MNILKVKDRMELDRRVPSMPWYIEKFINYKLPDLSPSSLLEYVRDYEAFLGWLIAEGLAEGPALSDVKLEELEKLRMDSIDGYRMFLASKPLHANSRTTVSRKLSSLRSLFHYLSQIAEDEDFYPLLKRNVMAKVAIKRTHKPKDTAAKLEGKLLQEEELDEFLRFVKSEYGQDPALSKQALHAFEKNSTRDCCIVSLILHSGLRVSEVVNLNVDDLDLKKSSSMRTARAATTIRSRRRSISASRRWRTCRPTCSCGTAATPLPARRRRCSSPSPTARRKARA